MTQTLDSTRGDAKTRKPRRFRKGRPAALVARCAAS